MEEKHCSFAQNNKEEKKTDIKLNSSIMEFENIVLKFKFSKNYELFVYLKDISRFIGTNKDSDYYKLVKLIDSLYCFCIQTNNNMIICEKFEFKCNFTYNVYHISDNVFYINDEEFFKSGIYFIYDIRNKCYVSRIQIVEKNESTINSFSIIYEIYITQEDQKELFYGCGQILQD